MRINLRLKRFLFQHTLLILCHLNSVDQFYNTLRHLIKLSAQHSQFIFTVLLQLTAQFSLLHLRHRFSQLIQWSCQTIQKINGQSCSHCQCRSHGSYKQLTKRINICVQNGNRHLRYQRPGNTLSSLQPAEIDLYIITHEIAVCSHSLFHRKFHFFSQFFKIAMYKNDTILVNNIAFPLPAFVGITDHIRKLFHVYHYTSRMPPLKVNACHRCNISIRLLCPHALGTFKVKRIIIPIPQCCPGTSQRILIHYAFIKHLFSASVPDYDIFPPVDSQHHSVISIKINRIHIAIGFH